MVQCVYALFIRFLADIFSELFTEAASTILVSFVKIVLIESYT